MQTKFKEGDMVQSLYTRACWHGIVISVHVTRKVYKRKTQELYYVKQLFTHDGRNQRIKRIVCLDSHWLRKSFLNEDGTKTNSIKRIRD